jgi:hypothetical protein
MPPNQLPVEDCPEDRVREHTRFSVKLDLTDVPLEYAYDRVSGEVSAFNDDLRVHAIGSTPAQAEQRFREALARRLQIEFRSGNGLPATICDQVTLVGYPRPRLARTKRGRLQPV